MAPTAPGLDSPAASPISPPITPTPGTAFGPVVIEYFRAGYQFLHICSTEETRVEKEIRDAVQRYNESAAPSKQRRPLRLLAWDEVEGVTGHDALTEEKLKGVIPALDAIGNNDHFKTAPYICFMRDLDEYFHLPPVRRRIRSMAERGKLAAKEHRRMVVIITPSPDIHPRLHSHISTLDFSLPDETALSYVLDGLQSQLNSTKPGKGDIDPSLRRQIIQCLRGLTSQEAENCVARCTVRHGGFTPAMLSDIKDEKAAIVKKSEVLTYIPESSQVNIDDIGGYRAFLAWLSRRKKAFAPEARNLLIDYPRGVILLGPPGCLHADTPIFDPVDGTTVSVKDRCEAGREFHVIALDEHGSPVVTPADPPKKFERTEMWKVTFADDSTMTVTPGHKFFVNGAYVALSRVAERLRAGGVCHLPTSSGTALEALLQDARHWRRKLEGSPGDYQEDSCSYDAQPLSDQGTSPGRLPSPGDAPRRIRCGLHADDSAATDTYTLSAELSRRYTPDCPPPSEMRNSRESSHPPRTAPRGHVCDSPRVSRQPVSASVLSNRDPLQADNAPASTACAVALPSPQTGVNKSALSQGLPGIPQQSPPRLNRHHTAAGTAPVHFLEPVASLLGPRSVSRGSEEYITAGQIIKIEPAEPAEYYDFYVPGFNNYWACGVWHHNSGKSMVAGAAGRLLGLPVYIFDIGAVFDKHVGGSEQKMRDALKQVDAQQGCVLLIDEADKALGNANESTGDSGVTRRVFGALLTWLATKTSPTFVIMTINRTAGLPPELLRAGRFDGMFYTAVPQASETREILEIHLRKRGVNPDALGFAPEDWATLVEEKLRNYLGAEIEEVVKEARYLSFDARGSGVPTLSEFVQAAASVISLHSRDAAGIEDIMKYCQAQAKPVNDMPARQVAAPGRRNNRSVDVG
jgi:ATP-dependent 26S proteasome regulatory subunit